MKPKYLFPPLALCVLLSACAHQGKPAPAIEHETSKVISHTPSSTKEIVETRAASLLEFSSDFNDLGLEAQKKELALILQKIADHHDEIQQKARAALIYAHPGSRLRDALKAQPLLEELAREKRLSKEERTIISLLKDNAAEISKLNQRIREEQKRSDDNQQKADALQQKLDELKKIERTMMQKSLKDPGRSSSK